MAITYAWASNTLTFDDATHVINTLQKESAAQRVMDRIVVARKEGEFIANVHGASKVAHVEGTLILDTQTNLEIEIDSFKKIIHGDPLNDYFGILSFPESGVQRECDAILLNPEAVFTRQRANITYLEYSFDFLIPSGSIRKATFTDTSTTAATTGYTTKSVVLAGTKTIPMQQTVTFTDATPSSDSLQSIILSNKTTAQSITLTPTGAFSNTDRFVIDPVSRTAKRNAALIDYVGVFPELVPGTNDLTLEMTKSTTVPFYNIDIQSSLTDVGLVNNQERHANSFTTVGAISVSKILIPLSKVTPLTSGTYGDLTVRIETASGSIPSGTLVTNGSAVISSAIVMNDSVAYVEAVFSTPPALAAATKYFIVAIAESTNRPHGYRWSTVPFVSTTATGDAASSFDDGATWIGTFSGAFNRGFKVFVSADVTAVAANWDIRYLESYL